MVVFDIMVSHFNMTRWHEAGLTQHKGDLAAVQAGKAACKQRLLQQSPQLPASTTIPDSHTQLPTLDTAAQAIPLGLQHHGCESPLSFVSHSALNQSPGLKAVYDAGEPENADQSLPKACLPTAMSALNGQQSGVKSVTPGPASNAISCAGPTVGTALPQAAAPQAIATFAGPQPAQLDSPRAGSLVAGGSSPSTPKAFPAGPAASALADRNSSPRGQPTMLPAAVAALAHQPAGSPRALQPQQGAVSSSHQQQQQQQQASTDPSQQQQHQAGLSPEQQQQAAAQTRNVRFDSQVPASPVQAAAAGPQQHHHARHAAHHCTYAAGEKVHAAQKPAKADAQQQWRAELEVRWCLCMRV